MSKIDLNEFKSLVPNVKEAIRKTLKVDAGTQSAFDIMAASHGFKDYHSVKSKANLPYYELRANLGTGEKPFHVTLDLGHYVDRAVVDMEARDALKGCQQFQTWFLYCDGENTHIKLETSPEPEKGFVYQIEVTGDTLDDVEQGIEEVASRLDNVMGFDSNETGGFSFRRVGEEYDFTEDTLNDMDIEQGPDGLIFDENGVILAKLQEMDDTGELDDAITDMGGRPEFSAKTLFGGASVPTNDVMDRYKNDFDTETYHLFGMNKGKVYLYFKGNVSDVVEHLKENAGNNLVFWVYEEMGSSDPGSDDETFLKSVIGRVISGDSYALIDDSGVVYSSDDEQKIEEMFNFAHEDIDMWEGIIYESYRVPPSQILKARKENYLGKFIVVSVDDKGDHLEMNSGSPDFIVELCLTKAFQGRQLMFFKMVRSL